MNFKPGMISNAEAAELNRLQREVTRLMNLRVAGPTMRLYRGPANIVIESTAAGGVTEESGSGGGGGDLETVSFTYLYDVTVTAVCNPDFTITLTTTKTYRRTSITGPDITITTITL